MTFTGQQLRLAWLRACIAEYERPVRSVGDEARISEYFRGIRWQWALDQYSGGVYSEVVRQATSHALEWCGIGPAWVGVHTIGHHLEDGVCLPVRLRPGIAEVLLPSTRRITERARWDDKRVALPMLEPIDIRAMEPGDLATVQTRSQTPFVGGDHWVVVEDVISPIVSTIEFNAKGRLGDGTQGRGVVHRTRPLSSIRRVYRFTEEHFDHEL